MNNSTGERMEDFAKWFREFNREGYTNDLELSWKASAVNERENLKKYIGEELDFHRNMLEKDKKDGTPESEIKFRRGIISQLVCTLNHLGN
jgi:hypothetical protein